MSGRTPRDLALYVYGRLPDPKPAVPHLEHLIHTLFLASTKLEEGRRISCSVCYVDPKKPDPDPPNTIRDPRWRYFPFLSPINFTVGDIAKLALASDPSVSSLAVFPDKKGSLKIWGMVDQQGGFQALLNHEGSGWWPPGIMQVQIVAPGHVVVSTRNHLLGELCGDVLTEDPIDIFGKPSTIYNKWALSVRRRIDNIRRRLKDSQYSSGDLDVEEVWDSWTKVIRRILLRAKSFGTGGAFLVTEARINNTLTIKYPILYDRLPQLFENCVIYGYMSGKAYDRISECLDDDGMDSIEIMEYLDESISESSADDARSALTDAIAFVSSLSRVDGAVLLDTDFVVHGFGCEIVATPPPSCNVFCSNRSIPKRRGARTFDPAQFGTRHRSMIRYCSIDDSAIGFVVSHDGPVRAFSKHGESVFVWDNAKLTNTVAGVLRDPSSA